MACRALWGTCVAPEGTAAQAVHTVDAPHWECAEAQAVQPWTRGSVGLCSCGAVSAFGAVPNGDVAHVHHRPQTENGTQG